MGGIAQVAVMVGAGASYGCGRVSPGPPPLGDGLYRWLREQCPGTWRAIKGALHERFEKDGFEVGMYEAWTNYSEQTQNMLIDMARAFARFKLPADGSDLYTSLLRGLVANRLLDRTVFSSLNYECLLEQAGGTLGLPVGYWSTGRPVNALVILKPHGSCNLLPDTGTNVFHNIRITTAGGSSQYFAGPVKPVPLDEIERLTHNSLPPAMSLYAPGKHTPVALDWVNKVRDEWRDVAVGCQTIAIIGVRPIWADAHLWEPVIESKARVLYIGGTADHATLVKKLTRDVEHVGRTFVEGIRPLNERFRIVAGNRAS